MDGWGAFKSSQILAKMESELEKKRKKTEEREKTERFGSGWTKHYI